MRTNLNWVDTHPYFLHTDCRIFRLREIKDANELDVQADAVMPSHTTSDQHESQGGVPDDATTPTRENLKVRYLTKPAWMIIDQVYSSLILLTPMWFQLSIYGVSVWFSWRGGSLPSAVPSAMTPQCGCPKTRVWPSLVGRSAGV